MVLSTIVETISYYIEYFRNHFMCSRKNKYHSLHNYDTDEYSFVMRRYYYHPPPKAEPNAPLPPSFAAIGTNGSALGVAAPTNGVESC